jgi:hypothetical protein
VPFTFDVSRVVGASTDAVWDLISDTTRWAEWSPAVAAVECDDRYVRSGSEGRVQTRLGLWVAFTVTDFEPERLWRWKVASIPATGHRVEPVGTGSDPGAARVAIEVPLWAAPYAGVSAIAVRRIEHLAELSDRAG